MRPNRIGYGRLTACVAMAAALTTGLAACSSSSNSGSNSGGGSSSSTGGGASTKFAKPSGSVRGFDGSTITVAGLGMTTQFPGADAGVRARVKRFNDTKEIPGITINYKEYANSGQDPATALSEARRVVSSDKAFAIVGDTSQNNPGPYFKQQQVPYFGWGFDNTYCSDTPSTDVWGFGWDGCQVPDKPKVMPDGAGLLYTYVKQQTGKAHPTVAIFANSTESGKNAVSTQSVAYTGVGFNVVMKAGLLPPPPISDYTAYAQQLLGADKGKAPDSMVCLLTTECINLWGLLKANGYKGIFVTPLYSDLLLGPMQGSVAAIQFVALNQPGASINRIRSDVKAVAPKQALDTGVLTGYWGTDMFIQALESVVKAGKQYISPANVQKAASTMTWQMSGLVGPVEYPASTQKATPSCSSIVLDTGKEWKTVVPYKCSRRTFPVS